MPSDLYAAPPDPAAAYPVVRLLVRFGTPIAIGLGVVVALGGLALTLAGQGWGWLPAGVLAGGFAGFVMRSYVELVRIITDLLLPR
jgi:hypothetical protein